jgi:hypothetical protein
MITNNTAFTQRDSHCTFETFDKTIILVSTKIRTLYPWNQKQVHYQISHASRLDDFIEIVNQMHLFVYAPRFFSFSVHTLYDHRKLLAKSSILKLAAHSDITFSYLHIITRK